MTKTYVVSGCGMKFDAAPWPVPANVEIHFYFQCMREPQFYKTRTILDKMMLEVGMFPDRVAVAGELIPSHFVWAHAGEQPRSGVFRRSTGNLAMDLADTEATTPVALSHVVKTLASDRRSLTSIHWIVRDEEAPADLSGLACQYPPRIRSAAGDEESNLVPLSEPVALAFERHRPSPIVTMGPTEAWPGLRRRAGSR